MPDKDTPKKDIGSEFANLTSHQLRTPLSGTKWLLELLQKDSGNLTKQQKDFLEKINMENDRMIALVNDILEVTRIESGQTKLYLQPTDIAAVIRMIMKEKEKEIQKKQLQISFAIEHEPFPEVLTEMNKMKQALLNLLSNAISYTPAGGKISVDLKIQANSIQGTITDTGVGIPKEVQKQIFSKFFRGPNVTAMETSGTGLGLYIAKSFIEASGGKLWFTSQEGKGTSFYFTLPIAK